MTCRKHVGHVSELHQCIGGSVLAIVSWWFSRGGLLVVFWGCALGGLPVVVMVTVVLVVNVVVDMDVVVICHWRTVWSWDCRDSDPRIWPLESCGVLSNENLVIALEGGQAAALSGFH